MRHSDTETAMNFDRRHGLTVMGAATPVVSVAAVALLVALAPTATTALPPGFTLDTKTASLSIPTQIFFGPFEASGRCLVVEKNKGILIAYVAPIISLCTHRLHPLCHVAHRR
jgi:hypothetical protein